MEDQDFLVDRRLRLGSVHQPLGRNTYGLATHDSAIRTRARPTTSRWTSGGDQGYFDGQRPLQPPFERAQHLSASWEPGPLALWSRACRSRCATGDSGDYAVRQTRRPTTRTSSPIAASTMSRSARPRDLSARPFHLRDAESDQCTRTTGRLRRWGFYFLRSINMPALMATPQYRAGTTAIFITWDENAGASGNQVPCIAFKTTRASGVKDSTPVLTLITCCCARRSSCSGCGSLAMLLPPP